MAHGKGNKTCVICGKKYEYCPSCAEDRLKPSYMNTFDCENCKNIYDVCSRYLMEKETKENSKKKLLQLDLSYRNNYQNLIKKAVDELLEEEKEITTVASSTLSIQQKKKTNRKNKKKVIEDK